MKQKKRDAVIAYNILKFLMRPEVSLRAARIIGKDRELAKLKVKRVQ